MKNLFLILVLAFFEIKKQKSKLIFLQTGIGAAPQRRKKIQLKQATTKLYFGCCFVPVGSFFI
ncbi:TPA: hypothetical protein ACOW35_002141 [Enterococcus faecalis]